MNSVAKDGEENWVCIKLLLTDNYTLCTDKGFWLNFRKHQRRGMLYFCGNLCLRSSETEARTPAGLVWTVWGAGAFRQQVAPSSCPLTVPHVGKAERGNFTLGK